jgi:hypothetical protein
MCSDVADLDVAPRVSEIVRCALWRPNYVLLVSDSNIKCSS